MDQMYGYGRGGTEQQVLRLLRGLPRHGVEPRLIFLQANDWHEQLDIACPWSEVPSGRRGATGWVRAVRHLRAEVEAHHASVVMTFFDDAMFVGALHSRLVHGIRLVATQRNMGTERSKWSQILVGAAMRQSDAVVVNSADIGQALVSRWPNLRAKVEVIPNLPPVVRAAAPEVVAALGEIIDGLRQRHLVPGVVIANLRPVKGVDDLVRALALEPARSVGAAIVVLGDGPMKSELQQLATKLGLGERLVFYGHVDAAAALLPLFDFGVIPSHAEGSANVGLEMASAGLPFVATEVGGNLSLLAATQGGIGTAARSPERLSQAVAALAKDAEHRKLLSMNLARFGSTAETEEVVLQHFARAIAGTGDYSCSSESGHAVRPR